MNIGLWNASKGRLEAFNDWLSRFKLTYNFL